MRFPFLRLRRSLFAVAARSAAPALFGGALLLVGCSHVYYNAMEKMGIPKREILVDRVGEARKSQEEAKEQFANALEKFISVTKYEGGELQAKYEQLNSELTRSETRATDVRDRIAAVADVSQALFSEWKSELSQYSDASLRAKSQQQFETTHRRYDDLMRSMRSAAAHMDPILSKFRDQVLFLKHNLNARAIAGLTSVSQGLQDDVSRLITDMERSIREADEFIKSMKAEG